MTGTNPPYGQHDPYSQQDPSGGWYTQPIQAPPQPPRRGMSTGAIIGIVVAIVAVLCVGAAVAFTLVPPPKEQPAAADGNAGTPAPYDTSDPNGQTTAPPTSAAPPPAAGPMTSFGDGTHEVGNGAGQIPPGTYTATVPDQAFDLCLWSRLKGFSGEGKDTIAFGTGNKGEKMRVTIAATDKGFETDGCGTWAKT